MAAEHTLFHKLCSNSATLRLNGKDPAMPVMHISSSADCAKILASQLDLFGTGGSPPPNVAYPSTNLLLSQIVVDAMIDCFSGYRTIHFHFSMLCGDNPFWLVAEQ